MMFARYLAREEQPLLPQSEKDESFPTCPVLLPNSTSQFNNPLDRKSACAMINRCAIFLKPSFLRRPSLAPDKNLSTDFSRKRNTEYLDGIRGIASLIVFIFHWSHLTFPNVHAGYGYKDHRSIWQLPYIRLVYSGSAMVSVFFIVSGFVLSHRFIQRMHRREYAEVAAGLTSMTFRRAFRLLLPSFVSSLMAYLCASLGLFPIPANVGGHKYQHSLTAWIDFLDHKSNPWEWNLETSGLYNAQLWSIAVEFRGSMVVFLAILGLAKCKTEVRMISEGLMVLHSFGHKRWDLALFIAGMLLAEIEVLYHLKRIERTKWVNLVLVGSLLIGGFLCGYPRDHPHKTPGYSWSAHVWPLTAYRRRFWISIGAVFFVAPVPFMPCIQRVFTTRFCLYLGKISFALYLVHGLGNRTVGNWLVHGAWAYTGKETGLQISLGFAVASVFYTPIVIWWSDIFYRAVDMPSTNLARWIEKKCAA